jgi:hypothetical protein
MMPFDKLKANGGGYTVRAERVEAQPGKRRVMPFDCSTGSQLKANGDDPK